MQSTTSQVLAKYDKKHQFLPILIMGRAWEWEASYILVLVVLWYIPMVDQDQSYTTGEDPTWLCSDCY